MSEILVLIRAHAPWQQIETLAGAAQEMAQHLSKVMGFQGFSVWQEALANGDSLLLFEYADVNAAERGLEAWAEALPTLTNKIPFDSPANVQRVAVSKRIGTYLSRSGNDTYLSQSFRIADSGQIDDLLEDVDMVFEGLQYMPGVISGAFGVNEALAEEVVGIATWENEAACRASMPDRDWGYRVNFFHRLV